MAIYRLEGKIQHYDWGGKTFLPQLLGVPNAANKPFAELWMGTHHRGEAQIHTGGTTIPLSNFIQKNPADILGTTVADKFNQQLPFLFKVLSVDKMLSIQSHPTKAQAERGFALENAAGVPLDAFHRNFKDDNHKPEVMIALTDFWLLHGFKSAAEITAVLEEKAVFAPLLAQFADANNFNLYKYIMELPQAQVNEMLQPLAEELRNGKYDRNDANYWAKLAFADYTRDNGDYDRGVFSIYLFNLVKLERGEGIFQAAGVPHAYLEGVNMELMANSDNVFRGGLTPKHVDVPKLLEHLVFESVTPQVLTGKPLSTTEQVFPTPAPDFELRKIDLSASAQHTNSAEAVPAVIIVMEGAANVKSGDQGFARTTGEIFFVTANTDYTIHRTTDTATLFKATVPLNQNSL